MPSPKSRAPRLSFGRAVAIGLVLTVVGLVASALGVNAFAVPLVLIGLLLLAALAASLGIGSW